MGASRGSFLFLIDIMRVARVVGVALILFLCMAISRLDWGSTASVQGLVHDAKGPVSGAQVRWQGTHDSVLSDHCGQFCLREGKGRPITAWKPGYRLGWAHSSSWPQLSLVPLPEEDNSAYNWLPPDPDPGHAVACGNCHQTIHREWAGSAHASSASNPRVLGMITGKGTSGTVHPRWNLSRELPLGMGVCSRCHAPTYQSTDFDYDLRKVEGVAARGVHCDLCHKVVDVPTDKLGLRFGIDGLTLLRPQNGDQLFYGPLPDAVRPGESFGHFPLYGESRYCASCHEGTVFGVKVYTTYSEWRASPAAQKGLQCQNCHMAPTGMTNVAPGKGGIERDPRTLSSHAMRGATLETLQKCVECRVDLEPEGHISRVTVNLRARNVGHRVPTGFIDRHLLLLVQAWNGAGAELNLLSGPILPPKLGDPWATKAGAIFGRWLVDEQGNSPLPFWVPYEKDFDTRLWPEKNERRTFEFPADVAKVRVRLIYRRFWPEFSTARGWDDQIVLYDQTHAGKPTR